MATALTNYTQDKYDFYDQQRQSTQTDYSEAVEALTVAQLSYDDLVKDAAKLETDIAAIRVQVSASSHLPSDIETLAEQLRQLLLSRRHTRATLAAAGQEVKFLQIKIEGLEQNLTQLTQIINAVADELSTAQQRQQQHEVWLSNDTEEAISELRDLATDLLAENPIVVAEGEENPAEVLAAARSRIEADIPEVLLTRASARATSLNSKLAAAATQHNTINGLLLSHNNASSGAAAVVAQRWAEYQTAEQGIQNYALATTRQYQYALDLLASVVASKELTEAEQNRITDISLEADALTTEAALQIAQAAVDSKTLELNLAITNAIINDVNGSVEDDAQVQARTAELQTLTTELGTAQAAHTEQLALAIDLWEVAIPDAIWANLQAFNTAINTLTAIKDSDGSALADAFNDAETALVTALSNDDNNNRLSRYLNNSVAEGSAQMAYWDSNRGALLLSTLRGDH